MTLIWATKIKGKWTLLADSSVSIWDIHTDANYSYRPKIREIMWKHITLITAWCGVIRDIDFALNILEESLENKKFKTKKELKFFLQNELALTYKTLKELSNDPSFELLILEPKTDTLFATDGYGITEPKGYANIVLGTWDTNFYKSLKYNQFWGAFKHAVECNDHCDYPIITYRDWKTNARYWMEDDNTFYKLVCVDEQEEKIWTPVSNDEELRDRYICDWTDKAL